MKNINKKHVNRLTGFNLTEVIIALTIFSILAASGSVAFFQSQKQAHANMIHHRAQTAVQSYIEQIQDAPYNTFKEFLADAANLPLPTTETGDQMRISDGLFLNIVNHKHVAVNSQENAEGENDTHTMDLFITPTVETIVDPDGSEVLEFTFEYRYETHFNGMKEIHGGIAGFLKYSD